MTFPRPPKTNRFALPPLGKRRPAALPRFVQFVASKLHSPLFTLHSPLFTLHSPRGSVLNPWCFFEAARRRFPKGERLPSLHLSTSTRLKLSPLFTLHSSLFPLHSPLFTLHSPLSPHPSSFFLLPSSFLLALLLCAALTAPAQNVVTSELYGTWRVASAATNVAIAVAWTDPDETNAIAPTNLLDATELDAGDELLSYDETTGKYRAWQLQENGTWAKIAVHATDGTTDRQETEGKLTCGKAVWLRRRRPCDENGNARTFTTSGKAPTGNVETTCAAGLTLLAAPVPTSEKEYDAGKNWESLKEGDKILVPDGDAPILKEYTWRNETWTETSQKKEYVAALNMYVTIGVETNVAPTLPVPSGTGFWFYSREGGGKKTW